MTRTLAWPDGKTRCCWANPANPAYIRYHDEEWGVPVHDDGKLFEMLLLESFQAGLSWECVLNKREAFRAAFADFQPERIAAFTESALEALRRNAGIIRNRLKIQAAVTNARIFLDIQATCGSFATYLWGWTSGATLHERGRTRSPLSDALSRDLTRRGMKFAGSTIIYAYLQSVGVIASHEADCFLARRD